MASPELQLLIDKLAMAKKAPRTSAPAKSQEDKKKELGTIRKKEQELFQTWKTNGYKPEHLKPLMQSLKPLIKSQSSKWEGRVEVPKAAIFFEHEKQAYNALKKYDPSKGELSTWVGNYLKKAGRFVQQTQNFARITEPIIQKIGKYKAVKDDLTERLGHEPDDHALHEELMPHGFSLKDVKRLGKEVRKTYIDGVEGTDVVPASVYSPREHEVLQLIQHQLNPTERIVLEYSLGLNGKPKLGSGAIAKKLKLDNSKVSKLRSGIFEKMKPHLE